MDLIERQAAIDIERNATVDTNPMHFEAHQKFTQFMDDAEISSFGRWQWSNGFNTALTAVGIDLKKLPSAQPYTEAELQKMQELEQAEIQKAYELGKLDAESRWIPCSERLPEVHESGNSFSGIFMQSIPVLVYGICEGEENAQFHVATYCDDLDGTTYWSTELDALTVTCVKAWMPLPEPYREEGTE